MNDVSQIVPPQRILLGLGGRGGRRRGGRLSLSLGHAGCDLTMKLGAPNEVDKKHLFCRGL